MTLDILNEHLHTLWEYQAASERLEAIRAVVLGAQRIDGMPHGTGVSNKIEQLAIIMSDQESDVQRLEKMLRKSEKIVRRFVDGIPDNHQKLVFKLRFLCGMSWAEVAKALGGKNTPESVKMMCYRFLMYAQRSDS